MEKNIFLDTDIGCDCDDAGAIYILNVFCDSGNANIKAITHTTSQQFGIACVTAINHYFGRDSVPLGVLKEDGFLASDIYDTYATKTAEKYPFGILCRDEAEDAIDVMRKTLSEAADNSIDVCFIGQLKNAANFLRSKPDQFSRLNGIELFGTKVREVIVMGGKFTDDILSKKSFTKDDAEYNIYSDIESARYFCDNCPAKIVFCGFELGADIITCSKMPETENDSNPVSYMYETHGGERPSWDLLAVLYAVRGLDDYFRISDAGTVSISEIGVTVFNPDKNGKHYFLKEKLPKEQMEALLNQLLTTPPKLKHCSQEIINIPLKQKTVAHV